ncbi:MAG: hypothetical protein ACF8Q5_10820 [Phycisphaerales bacterium JB040]
MPEHEPTTPASGDRPAHPSRRVLALIPPAVFALIGAAFIGSGYHEGRASWDSRHFHEPTVRALAEQLPAPDFSNYLTATTPGYHLLLALPVRAGLDSVPSMRVCSAVITAVLLFVLARALVRRAPPLLGVALTLPLIASNYTLLPGVFVLPDNLAWLLVLAVLLRTLAGRVSPGGLAVSGVLLALLVFTRQIHLWAAGLVWLGAWMAPDHDAERPLWAGVKRRLPRTLLGVACTLPAFAIVGWFYRLWGGLTPPRFQVTTQSWSPSLPAFLLLEIAVLSVFFAPWLLPRWLRARPDWRTIALVVIACVPAIVLAIVPETTWSFDEGRASGWWNVVRRLPVIAGHTSVLVLLGAPAGAVALLLWGAALSPRSRWIMGLGLLGFALSQTASANVWQRYHEPFLLMLMAIACAETHARGPGPRRTLPIGLASLAALACFLGAFTVLAVLGGDRDPDKQAPDVFGVERPEGAAPGTTPENREPGDPPRTPSSSPGP